jgi:hypothetical protein
MHPRTIILGIALAAAGWLAGCAPGPAGYAGWSQYREREANEHAYLAHRNAEAAQWQAQKGDYYGARQSQMAAQEEADQAQQAQAHANRDRFFSGF